MRARAGIDGAHDRGDPAGGLTEEAGRDPDDGGSEFAWRAPAASHSRWNAAHPRIASAMLPPASSLNQAGSGSRPLRHELPAARVVPGQGRANAPLHSLGPRLRAVSAEAAKVIS